MGKEIAEKQKMSILAEFLPVFYDGLSFIIHDSNIRFTTFVYDGFLFMIGDTFFRVKKLNEKNSSLPSFCWGYHGGVGSNEDEDKLLTAKQKIALKNIENICYAFWDRSQEKYVKRTWREIEKKTGLSKCTLHKHIKELLRQEVIKGTVELDEKDRLKNYYTYTKKCYRIEAIKSKPVRIIYRNGKKLKPFNESKSREGDLVVYSFDYENDEDVPSAADAFRLYLDKEGNIADYERGYLIKGKSVIKKGNKKGSYGKGATRYFRKQEK